MLSENPIAVTKILLENGANILATNSQGDNVLHYAANHCVNVKLFELLLQHLFVVPTDLNSSHTPMETLLLKNDAGQSILHMLVNRPNTFLHIKTLLGAIDKHLSIQSPGSDIWDVERLLQVYRYHISQFDKKKLPIELRPEKMAVLNQPESLSGRSPLFLALKQETTSTVLLLLAHYADPMVTDRSGVDCSILVKDEDRYKTVHTYVMKALCLNLLNPIRYKDKSGKRKYTKRTDNMFSAECELQILTASKMAKKSS